MADPASKKRKTFSTSTMLASGGKGRTYTLSIAVPSTLLSTAANPVLKTHLAGQLARICALHNVDEIVLYSPDPKNTSSIEEEEQLSHILTYLETPPYLRKHLFPLHPRLRHVGLLPSLDLPSHVKVDEPVPFRDGVALEKLPGGKTSCDVGLGERVVVASAVKVGARLTLRMNQEGVEVVPKDTPRKENGTYAGYTVRRAGNLSAVFTESPWKGGYDLTVGTSNDGVALDKALDGELPEFQHLLVAVGGLKGAARRDVGLVGMGVEGAMELFDLWVDAVPGSGSGVVRVEEVLWGALVGLRRVVTDKGVR